MKALSVSMCQFLVVFSVLLFSITAPSARAQDDPYEPNNSTNEATDLSGASGLWLSENLGLGIQCDDDWYRIEVPAGQERVLADCLFSTARGDLTLELYDSNAVYVTASSGFEDNEGLDYVVAAAGRYYLRVTGPGSCNEYNLQWDALSPVGGPDDAYEANNSATRAYNLRSARATPLSLLAGPGQQCDPDWFQIYAAPGSERVIVHNLFTNTPGNLHLELRDELGRRVALSWTGTDFNTLDLVVPTPGVYFAKVPGLNACDEYDLWWDSRIPPGKVGPPVVVALLYDGNYVDTSDGGAMGEAFNLRRALEAMSVRVNTFTGITDTAFNINLARANVLLIPELELANLGAALTPGAVAEITRFVAGGGCLVLHGEMTGHDQAFLSAVFGFTVQQQGDFSGATSTNTGDTAGTAFEGGPPSLGGENGLYPWLASSLPAGSSSLYQFESGGHTLTTVGVIPYGAGRIVLLAWDWFDAAPWGTQDKGWNSTLLSALAQCACEPLLTSVRKAGPDTIFNLEGGFKHTYRAWFTDGDLKGSPAWAPFGSFGERTVTVPLDVFPFVDDYGLFTSGGPSLTGRRTYRVAREPTVTAPEVAVLLDPNYVDMNLESIPAAEGPNLAAALHRMRYEVIPVNGIAEQDFLGALRPEGYLLIPELEGGNLGADLSAGARAAITNFVQAGGVMIVHGSLGPFDENLVNTLFGYSIDGIGDMSAIDTTGTAARVGTAFERCPATISGNDGLFPWIPGTVPPGAAVMYETPANDTNYASVVVIPEGLGRVVLLAWDWWSGAPQGALDGGWNDVLNATFKNWSGKDLFVGYYDLEAGQGSYDQVAPIQTAGHMPASCLNVAARDLYGLDVLFLQNPSNDGYAEEFTNNLEAVRQAVMGGMTLVFHDRAVTNITAQMLPGGAGIAFARDTASPAADNINIATSGTLVTDGPGGVLDNSSLDIGGSSSHGYADEASLPAGAVNILSRPTSTEVVTFAYPYGAGWVVYSTIPLDYFLLGNGPAAFRDIYAPNIVEYGCELH
ncbi:MAG: PPC domain-containing protein [Kiritimatiellae bacterium]|nr:PPC domain-containing protein [Kiritimatiellia bacterium]